ncbi:ABC transporter substrate-binding protein [Microbacterium ulmi]|uniref:ABC transporter substrate-binding protein n=1 Tax=Microbacterium ulmi TaxID=179095 RepID=A0A7Y2LY94_9MICO|nr:ABC transporter substrate-binding protein [Microbacterium ulmi]NII68449.1 peptide/nickel transport system substrate-binding protein [Microbacterium ulmi]NNH03029.1 ABC transporter substrate-binding protein [Microbacterium ulmi]
MRLKSSLAAAGLAVALALTGCSASGNQGGAADGAALTIAKPDGAIASESNNPWIGDSSALKLGYVNAIFEPLAFVNVIADKPVTPWLASEIEWADDYRSVTVTARDGVTWNDGEPFTADDIRFTFELLRDNPAIEPAALGITDVTVDGDKVTIGFQTSVFVKQDKVLEKFIVPEHIWKDVEDVTTETNPEPVGTGPYTLTSFSSQSVQLDQRDDYWGGELAVPTLYFVSYNDNTALTTALANGDADWAQGFIPNIEDAYLSKDEHNQYWAPAGLGVDALWFNVTKKPFDDKALRQALNLIVDRDQHREVAREGSVPALTSVTGLPQPAGDPFIIDRFQGEEYTVDVDGAKAILEAAGYTWDGAGKLIDPDGEQVTFTLQVPQGWSDYVTGITLIAEEVKAIGIDATVDTPDVDTWWAAKGTGDFDAILHWTDTGLTPWDIYSNIMDGARYLPIGEQSEQYNFGRFNDPEITQALADYANAADDATRQTALEKIQTSFVDEAVALPIGTRPFIGEFNTRNYVGWPSEEDPYAVPEPTRPQMLLVLTKLQAAE